MMTVLLLSRLLLSWVVDKVDEYLMQPGHISVGDLSTPDEMTDLLKAKASYFLILRFTENNRFYGISVIYR